MPKAPLTNIRNFGLLIRCLASTYELTRNFFRQVFFAVILPPFPECEFLAGRKRLHGRAADAVEHHLLDLLPTRPSSFDGDTAELVGVRHSEATKVLTTAQMLESPITAWKNLFVKAIHIITRPAPVAKTITLAMNQKRLGCIFLLSRRTNIATLNGLLLTRVISTCLRRLL